MTRPPPGCPFPDAARVHAATAATWPAASIRRLGPWVIRDGQGGGSRVSAATATGPVTPDDLTTAEAAMAALGQSPLFMIRETDGALDAMLHAAGYRIMDPVTAYAAKVDRIATRRPPPATTFEVWPPLAVQCELWAAAGIGPARLAVMQRALDPRTTILGRLGEAAAGTAFVACDGSIAMLHALVVAPQHRRQGLALLILRASAFWAAAQGASHLALAVTRANTGANRLYASIGMIAVGQYHYRIRPEPSAP